jgi:hypothetical protein
MDNDFWVNNGIIIIIDLICEHKYQFEKTCWNKRGSSLISIYESTKQSSFNIKCYEPLFRRGIKII